MNHPQISVRSSVPHRHPMLLIDRVSPAAQASRGGAVKAITVDESHREAAFTHDEHGLPGSLLVDALGQLAIQVLAGNKPAGPSVWYLAAIGDMEFGRSALPGDVLEMEASIQRSWQGTSRVGVRAHVRGETLAAGTMVLSTGAPMGQSAD